MSASLTTIDPDGPYRQLELTLRNRIYCDGTCGFFEDCPLQPLSFLGDDHKCLMKVYGEPLRRTFLNLSRYGEAGLVAEMRRCVFLFARKVEVSENLKDIERYFELLMKLHKVSYGEKGARLAEVTPPLDVTIKRVGQPGVSAGPTEVVVPAEMLVDEQLEDPESLFYNPEYAKMKSDS